jgi:hypothetical protein
MTSESRATQYEMVNVRTGHVIIEHDVLSRAARSYFSPEPTPPVEEYWEGQRIWKFWGAAQSIQFDVRDNESGEVIPFRELLGLMYYGCCREDTDLYRIGELAQENRISIYVAITYETAEGDPTRLSPEKTAVLNRLFNDRLRDRSKKILILPDMFDLYREMSYARVMIDFGLTAMEEAAERPPRPSGASEENPA